MTTKSKKIRTEPTLAATVSSEDIACGDYVALLSEIVDAPSYLWDACGTSLAPDETVRLKFIPDEAGQPLKVLAICLPFVYARSPNNRTVTLDMRRMQLVRLDRKCIKVLWKHLRSKRS